MSHKSMSNGYANRSKAPSPTELSRRNLRAARHLVRRSRNRLRTGQQLIQSREATLHTKLRLLEEELESAYRIQQSLLPAETPNLAELDIFVTSRPVRYLNGDFYDFIRETNRSFVFTIGDVAGKGAAAALLMATLHKSIRLGAENMSQLDPAEILTHANNDLYELLTATGRFVTAFAGYYDQVGREIVYAGAGHSPILYCPHRQPARLIPAKNLPLGIVPNTVYQSDSIKIYPGDVIVMTTDGLPETSNRQGELFGYARMKHIVETSAERSAQEISCALLNAVEDFRGDFSNGVFNQEDDQTILVIRNRSER